MNTRRSMRVLVVDDDDSLRSMICELLIEIGYELVGFANLDDTVDNETHRFGRGDLILIDVYTRRADEARAAIAAAFPDATVVCVRDTEYEAVLRARGRDRTPRARTTQPRSTTARVHTTS